MLKSNFKKLFRYFDLKHSYPIINAFQTIYLTPNQKGHRNEAIEVVLLDQDFACVIPCFTGIVASLNTRTNCQSTYTFGGAETVTRIFSEVKRELCPDNTHVHNAWIRKFMAEKSVAKWTILRIPLISLWVIFTTDTILHKVNLNLSQTGLN